MTLYHLIKDHHSTFLFNLLKEGYLLNQGATVILYQNGKIQLLINKSDHRYDMEPPSLKNIFIFDPLTVQKGKHKGENAWITGITDKMVNVEFESGDAARISKISLGFDRCKHDQLRRRSPRHHLSTEQADSTAETTALNMQELTHIEEADDTNFVSFDDFVEVKDMSTPRTKRVRFVVSVVSDVRTFEALGNLRPLFWK